MNTAALAHQFRPSAESSPPATLGGQEIGAMATSTEPLGAILVRNKNLTPSELLVALSDQSRNRELRIGEIAVRLKLCSPEDVGRALAEQGGTPILDMSSSAVDASVACAFTLEGRYVQSIVELRDYLIATWDHELPAASPLRPRGRTLSLLSPCRGDGRTTTSANLAVSYAQLGLRTVLIDCDLRNSRQQSLFGLTASRTGLADVLRSGSPFEDSIQDVPGLRGLAIIAAGRSTRNAQDVFGRQRFSQLLRFCAENYDIALIDTPASDEAPEALVISGQTHASVLVARAGKTSADSFDQLQHKLARQRVTILGSMMLG